MCQLMTPTNEEGRALRAPAGTTQRRQSCASPRPLSSRYTRELLPGRRDGSLPHPPAAEPQRASTDGAALGLLVLLLQRRDIPALVRQHGWALVEKWLRQFVEVRLAGRTV